tara:strand:+ start:229 stop:375 length:147 start_codon:yes stop_codon:yes gene_type:complete
MKAKISISLDNETLHQIEESLEDSLFRNKSHFLEHAAKKLLKEVKEHE